MRQGLDSISAMLSSIGIRHKFDSDGDITFLMRLPGGETLTDGSSDWRRIQYSLQSDLSIKGAFATEEEFTDWAKRLLRFYLIGSRMGEGVLGVQAFPRIVPSRFGGAVHVEVIPLRSEADMFNRAETTGIRAHFFDNSTFAVTAGLTGITSAAELQTALGDVQYAASFFLEGHFRGWLRNERA